MTAPPKSPTLLTELCDRLRALGEHAETAEARAEVEAALQSKWWSLRTVAIGVIGGWGGKANKAWLIERALEAQGHDPGRRAGEPRKEFFRRNAIAEAAARALIPHLGPEDAGWLLDRWFSDEALAPTLNGYVQTRMHAEPVERRVAEEFARKPKDRPRKQLLWLVFLRRGLPGRLDMLARLATGTDEIAEEAKRFLNWERRAAELEAAKPKKGAARAVRIEAEAAADAVSRARAGRKGRR